MATKKQPVKPAIRRLGQTETDTVGKLKSKLTRDKALKFLQAEQDAREAKGLEIYLKAEKEINAAGCNIAIATRLEGLKIVNSIRIVAQ